MMASRSCPTCGAPLSASAKFCPVCGNEAPREEVERGTGTPPPFTPPLFTPEATPHPSLQSAPYAPAAVQIAAANGGSRRIPGTATVSLVMGLMTWLLPFVLIGFLTFWVTAPLAVGCGVAARRTIAEDPDRWGGSGQANTGLALGLSALIVATLFETLLVFSKLG